MFNLKKGFTLLAIILATTYTVVMTQLGWSKLQQVMAHGVQLTSLPPYGSMSLVTRLLINLTYFGLTAIYLVWLLQRLKQDQRNHKPNSIEFSALLKPASIFLVLAWLTYPFSSDGYLYLQYGLMGLNKVNPYLTPATQFSSSLMPFLYWSQSSTYGAISQAFFMVSAIGVAVSPALALYGFKLFCVVLHIVNARLVWSLLQPSQHRQTLTFAYLLNPLLLTEQVADAHIDVFVCCALLVLIHCLYTRRYLWAVAMVWVGALVKTIPIIWLPLVLAFLLGKRQYKTLGWAILICLAVPFILSQTLLPNPIAWRSLLNPGVSGMTAFSIHHLLHLGFTSFLSFSSTAMVGILSIYKKFTYLGFGLFYAWTIAQLVLKRRTTASDLVKSIGWVTLVLILFATPWVMPWYSSILLPIAVVCSDASWFVLATFAFTLSAKLIVWEGVIQPLPILIMDLSKIVPPLAVIALGKDWSDRVAQKIGLKSQDCSLESRGKVEA